MKERSEIRKASKCEREYVLGLAPFAENVRTDGVVLFWDEPGSMALFSTQKPSRSSLKNRRERK
jgi:hypothetical protein